MIMTTQEKKIYLQTLKPSGIEELREHVKMIHPRNLIEKELQKDFLKEFGSATEKELIEAREETGVFFFFYDYKKKRG